MSMRASARSALLEENAALRARLQEAEDMLRAIRGGEVDALVVQSADGPQIYALQGQDAEANRFRGEMLAQVSDAVIATDREDKIIYLNAAAERLYGVAASGALGLTPAHIYESAWGDPDDEAAAATALLAFGQWRGENIHVRRDGRALNVESGVTVLGDIAGGSKGRLAVIRDVTERRQHETRVLNSEIRYRRLFETANDGLLILDRDTRRIIDANPLVERMLGCPRSELVGRDLCETGLFEDEAACEQMVCDLAQSEQVRYEKTPFRDHRGRDQEIEVVASLYDQNGSPVIQCNIRDVTDRKRTEEHVRLLMSEVNHRAKNLLGVVQAVALQTARYGDPSTIAARLSDRIGGLAAGQNLLVKNLWQGVEVADLVEAQLDHFQELIGTRVLIDGPRARLTPGAAQGIGMALHELATNAAKYGALSNLDGQVRIAWRVTADAEPEFSMTWIEDGGPRVTAPTRKGFGQVVIGRMAEAAVQGVAEINFRDRGLSWKLSAPAGNALARADGEYK